MSVTSTNNDKKCQRSSLKMSVEIVFSEKKYLPHNTDTLRFTARNLYKWKLF